MTIAALGARTLLIVVVVFTLGVLSQSSSSSSPPCYTDSYFYESYGTSVQNPPGPLGANSVESHVTAYHNSDERTSTLNTVTWTESGVYNTTIYSIAGQSWNMNHVTNECIFVGDGTFGAQLCAGPQVKPVFSITIAGVQCVGWANTEQVFIFTNSSKPIPVAVSTSPKYYTTGWGSTATSSYHSASTTTSPSSALVSALLSLNHAIGLTSNSGSLPSESSTFSTTRTPPVEENIQYFFNFDASPPSRSVTLPAMCPPASQ